MEFGKRLFLFLFIAAALVIGSFFVIGASPFLGTTMRWIAFLAIALAFVMRE